MEIVDSHQHFGGIGRFRYDWISPSNKTLYRNYLPTTAEIFQKASGVKKTVAVQAHQSLEEILWLLELANQYPFMAGVVGWVDLLSPGLVKQLLILTTYPKLKGIRHMVQDEQYVCWILQKKVIEGIRKVGEFGLTYGILIYPKHLKYIPKLIELCPNVRFFVDHLAKPPIIKGEIAQWKADLSEVAKFPQVFCKLSGLVSEADHKNWKLDDFLRYAETALKLFGTDRLMFGSDYPVCLLAASYSQVLELCLNLISKLSSNEQTKIMSENASNFYKI